MLGEVTRRNRPQYVDLRLWPGKSELFPRARRLRRKFSFCGRREGASRIGRAVAASPHASKGSVLIAHLIVSRRCLFDVTRFASVLYTSQNLLNRVSLMVIVCSDGLHTLAEIYSMITTFVAAV